MTDRQIARICHEANRAVQIINRDGRVNPHWPAMSKPMRESAERGVAKARAGATPEELHAAWCEDKRARGWTFGPEKNERLKTHPCLVPYGELPERERVKDRLFNAIVQALA
ncbi:hypothetical protein GS982_19910 [Rhodococcus hoagii]|nr:hypothetical protein [Prescottella equi]